MSYEVVCVDGRKRHEGTFGSRREAAHFAEWGHACINAHEIRLVAAYAGTPLTADEIADASEGRKPGDDDLEDWERDGGGPLADRPADDDRDWWDDARYDERVYERAGSEGRIG